MDYTPCAFTDSQHPHITTHAYELALTVLFESGLPHLADHPESFLEQPQPVRDFLSRLPAAWDETRYVSGYPGQSAVPASRRLRLRDTPAIVSRHTASKTCRSCAPCCRSVGNARRAQGHWSR